MLYIPHNVAQFNQFAQKLINYVIANGAKWAHIPESEVMGLPTSYIAFTDALALASTTPTSANIRQRNRARKVLEGKIRAFVNQFSRFPPVTDKDRDEMEIPL